MKTARAAPGFLACLSLLGLLIMGWGRGRSDPGGKAATLVGPSGLPLSFEANDGQTDGSVKFIARGRGYTLFLTPTEAVLAGSSPGTVLRLGLVGGDPAPEIVGLEELPGKSHYFIGNDPTKWRTNVPHYARVAYKQVYPGVDLVYYGTGQGRLEYDFVVAPGADPGMIRLAFEGVEEVGLDTQSNLRLETRDRDVMFRAPLVYQEAGGARETIPGSYQVHGNDEVSFSVAAYDPNRPLIIDPVLEYASYLGGRSIEIAGSIAADGAGNVYLAGQTSSGDFPLENPLQAVRGSLLDIFVTKLNPAGSALIYSTYIGGMGEDVGGKIAVDADGNAYVAGSTRSIDFPTTLDAFDTTCGTDGQCNPARFGGSDDVFVLKLSANGSSLLYSTYLGGSSSDALEHDIAIDSVGNAYLTGRTLSRDFPTTEGALQVSCRRDAFGACSDAFVAKLEQSGSELVYATYLGGNGFEEFGTDIVVDDAGNAYVVGRTNSTDFPSTGAAFQTGCHVDAFGSCRDAFVAKLDSDGSALVYATYLGGSGEDDGRGIALDNTGNVYVTGSTRSFDFPATVGALDTSCGSDGVCNVGSLGSFPDAFVAKLTADGSALVYGTYLGGSGADWSGGIAVDNSGNAHVIGESVSSDFPILNPLGEGGPQPLFSDVFVTRVSADGSVLIYSTFLGGSSSGERGKRITLDNSGNAYVTGETFSTDFPATLGAFSVGCALDTDGSCVDVFVAKIVSVANISVTKSSLLGPVTTGASLMYSLEIRNAGPETATEATLTDVLPHGATLAGSTASQGSCIGTETVTCDLGSLGSGETATVILEVTPTVGGSLSNSATVTANELDPDTGDNSATVTTTVNDFALQVSPASVTVSAGQSATYTVTVNSEFGPFGSSVSLACSGLPALSSCSFSPSSVTPGDSSANSTLTITTTGTSAALVPPPSAVHQLPIYALWWALAGLAWLGYGLGERGTKRKKLASYGALILALSLLALQMACSGGGSEPASRPSPRTPPGTSTITIAGSSGSLERTTTATLIVQ